MDYIITTEHLTKKYKNFTSVNHVSLHIRKGSIYGFLGPNPNNEIFAYQQPKIKQKFAELWTKVKAK